MKRWAYREAWPGVSVWSWLFESGSLGFSGIFVQELRGRGIPITAVWLHGAKRRI